jgi:hypothetical protein
LQAVICRILAAGGQEAMARQAIQAIDSKSLTNGEKELLQELN